MNKWENWLFWRADDKDWPFFHPSDAGFPIASLSYYYPLAPKADQARIKETIRKSLVHELDITKEVNNPFGYSRQLVQDTIGNRRITFFFAWQRYLALVAGRKCQISFDCSRGQTCDSAF